MNTTDRGSARRAGRRMVVEADAFCSSVKDLTRPSPICAGTIRGQLVIKGRQTIALVDLARRGQFYDCCHPRRRTEARGPGHDLVACGEVASQAAATWGVAARHLLIGSVGWTDAEAPAEAERVGERVGGARGSGGFLQGRARAGTRVRP